MAELGGRRRREGGRIGSEIWEEMRLVEVDTAIRV